MRPPFQTWNRKWGNKVVFDPEFASCVRKSDEVGLWIFRFYKVPARGYWDLGDLVGNGAFWFFAQISNWFLLPNSPMEGRFQTAPFQTAF
jgi:hypothetical protein